MASFNSPLGNRKSGNQQPLREFVVPDESQGQVFDTRSLEDFSNKMNEDSDYQEQYSSTEEEIRRARQEKITGRERMSAGAKQRLEILLGMVRSEREVELVSDLKIVLQSLKSQEQTAIFKEAAKNVMQIDYDFELRRQTLARSIKSVSGVLFSDFVGSDDFNDKLYFIDQMDDIALNKLYIEYGKLTKEAQEKFGIIKPEQQKEVAEDLKK